MAQLLPISDEMMASFGKGCHEWPAMPCADSSGSGLRCAGALVPGGARIVVFVIHRGQFLCPAPIWFASAISGLSCALRGQRRPRQSDSICKDALSAPCLASPMMPTVDTFWSGQSGLG